MSSTITVNPALVQSLGGNPQLLRDGGINGAAYNANPSGASPAFPPSSTLTSRSLTNRSPSMSPRVFRRSTSLMDFAADSIGWLELNRSEAELRLKTREAFRFRSAGALSNITGVSLDEEMSLLLELEQSYKASARLISAVDEMLQALMAAAR
jgi:flagellar hook-associated protein 1 FlgK